MDQTVFHFGNFTLLPRQEQLLRDGRPVRVGSRALAILLCLLEQAGELVEKDVLQQKVWPTTVVEEVSLRVHLAALRKALGDGCDGARYIVNVPGRGYRFVCPVFLTADGEADAASLRDEDEAVLIGRDRDLARVKGALSRRRLVTLVGPHGVGKSSLADMVLASWTMETGGDGACIDFGLGIAPSGRDGAARNRPGRAPPAIHAANGRRLVVLDNCEQVADIAARYCEAVFATGEDVCVLVTSRKPLGLSEEEVIPLSGLDLPPPDAPVTAASARAFAAIELFVQRANTIAGDFRLTDENAPGISDLCRWAGGLPLGIELAARRSVTPPSRGCGRGWDDPRSFVDRQAA